MSRSGGSTIIKRKKWNIFILIKSKLTQVGQFTKLVGNWAHEVVIAQMYSHYSGKSIISIDIDPDTEQMSQ